MLVKRSTCPGVDSSHGWMEGDISEDGNDDEDDGEDKSL